MITRVKVWTKQWKDMKEVRIYIDYTDANGVFRQGCWYKTGNPYEKARLENLTPEVIEEAQSLAVWDGYWHTLYREDCERRYAELAQEEQEAQQEEQEEQAPAPSQTQTQAQAQAQMPGRPMADGRRFFPARQRVGEPWQARDGSWWIVTGAEPVTVEDDRGWAHTVRLARPEEIPVDLAPQEAKKAYLDFLENLD